MREQYPYIGNPFGFELPKPKPIIHPIITKWEDFTENDKIILQNIKSTITSYIKDCELIVYGSRVKGNWTEDSDYDIVVLANPNQELKRKLKYFKYDVPVDLMFSDIGDGYLGVKIQ